MKVFTKGYLIAGFVLGVLFTALIKHPPQSSGDWAAWVQAFGSIVGIFAAAWIASDQGRKAEIVRALEREEKAATDRKMVMNAAALLAFSLELAETSRVFAPAGDGKIGHEMTLEQALEFMRLKPETWEALRGATEKSHYFSEDLCERIVKLRLVAASYDRIVEEMFRRTIQAREDADAFFRKMKPHNVAFADQIREVRELIQPYLPTR